MSATNSASDGVGANELHEVPELISALLSASDLARLDRLALFTRRRLRGEQVGERRTRRVGAGGEFVDYRTYVPGDDLRYVDWNVYFRLGDMAVKRFESVDAVRVLVAVDRSASMAGAKGLAARRLAAALCHVAVRRRDAATFAWLPPIEGRPPVETFRTVGRLAPLHDALVTTPDAGATDLARDLSRIVAAAGRRGPAVLLSDFFDPAGAVGGLSAMSAHGFETTALHVLDPTDAELPFGESLRCVDRETGEVVDVDVTPELQDSVRAAWRRRVERVRAWCAEREIGWVAVEVGRTLWDVLHELLKAGVVVGA
jgi:uncharacterized protein (DUF58 family)